MIGVRAGGRPLRHLRRGHRRQATITAIDTGATGAATASVAVTVPCAGGGSLTQGYWKTHSTFGPAPYDDVRAQLPQGANTAFFLSGKTYYQTLWTAPMGNAYFSLAHQYIAAQINGLNGADTSAISAAFAEATTLLQTYTPAQIGALKKGTVRTAFITLAATLDAYNNGVTGPGHCSE